MCTGKTDTKIITSNRDEMVTRPSAIAQKKLYCKWQECYHPKDPKAGGTWYVVDENGTVLVLLNGAEEKHTIKLRKSRGLIVLIS
jgi:uncharacterized protein with NRDE domain